MALALSIAALALLAGLLWYQRPTARSARTLRKLENRYYRRAQMPRHLAQEALQRHTAWLREQHPDRSDAWYISKVLADLDRDRR